MCLCFPLWENIFGCILQKAEKHKDGNNNTQMFSSVFFRGMCFSCVGIFMFHPVPKPLVTFWTFRSISVTTGSVYALRRTPPIEILVQEWVTYLQYTNVSTWLSCFHQSGGSWSGQISTKWIQKWLLIMQFSAKDKSQMWVSVGEFLPGVEEV